MTMVDDFDDADALVQSMFSPEIFMPKSWSDFDKRWASLNRVGPDFVLELMEASTAEEDQASPLPKFARRFGQHLHSFAWYVDADDHVPTFRRLRAGGVRVAGPSGLLPADIADEDVPDACSSPTRRTPSARSSWRRSRPGTPTRCSTRIGTARRSARNSRSGSCGSATSRTRSTTSTGRSRCSSTSSAGPCSTRRATRCRSAPTSSWVPTPSWSSPGRVASGTRLADDLAANGPLPHRATFRVKDLDAAVKHLEAIGTTVAERTDDTVVLDPATTFGALLAFTTAESAERPTRLTSYQA